MSKKSVLFAVLVFIFGICSALFLAACTGGQTSGGNNQPQHTHSYTAVATPPTCTQLGYTTHTCSCGDSYVDTYVNALGHTASPAVRENEVAASCEKAGNYDEVVYCSVCDTELSRTPHTVEKLAHTPATPVRENEVSASCEKAGSYDEVVYCSVCETELSRTPHTVEKLAHTPATPVRENEVSASCASEGGYDEVVYCSVCESEISRTHTVFAKKAHTYADGICKECGYIEDIIAFRTFDISGDSAHGKVPNFHSVFMFEDEILINGDSTYAVYSDKECTNEIPSKIINLAVGDNTYYVAASRGSEKKVFTVTVRRRPIYTVELNYGYGVWDEDSQIYEEKIEILQIEEDETLTSPEVIERHGYNFKGWQDADKNAVTFPLKITKDMQLTAIYEGIKVTATLDVNGGEPLQKTEYTLTYGSTFTLRVPEREGYRFVGWAYYTGGEGEFQPATNGSGISYSNIGFTEDVTLFALWRARQYNLSIARDDTYEDGGNITIIESGNSFEESFSGYIYCGAQLTFVEETKPGYEFIGWYEGEELLSAEAEYVFTMPARDVTVAARWQLGEGMELFYFDSYLTGECHITGIKDNTTAELVIPDYVTHISGLADCANLTSVTFAEGSVLQNIDGNAFSGCILLERITIPASVTYVGNNAFANCTSLEQAVFEDNSQLTELGYDAFKECKNLLSVSFGNGSKLKTIAERAFYVCDKLESVDFGENSVLGTISDFAFSECGFAEITIPQSVVKIGQNAFFSCENLTSVIFEITEGWQYCIYSYEVEGTEIAEEELSDPSSAAELLTQGYCRYIWKRV